MSANLEPWLRGTLTEIDPVRRQVLHALELAGEDARKWCAGLSEAQLEARPHRIASVAFHLRHMARSLDRLLTYAEGRSLSEAQLAALRSELAPSPDPPGEFKAALQHAMDRVRAIDPDTCNEPRTVGRQHLPTTVAGLLIHCAEHTQRHIGQAITTAQIVAGQPAHEPQRTTPQTDPPDGPILRQGDRWTGPFVRRVLPHEKIVPDGDRSARSFPRMQPTIR